MNNNNLEIACGLKEDMRISKNMMFRFYLFLVCIFNNIKDNLIIVALLLISAILLTIRDSNISQMLAGVAWSIFASFVFIEPISFYNNEKKHFKLTYLVLMQLNHWTGALLDFAKNVLMFDDIDIEDLYFGACQSLPAGKNPREFRLEANKKYFLLFKAWQKLFSDEFDNKDLEHIHLDEYRKLQDKLKWRMDSLFDDLEFHSSKRLLISNLFTSKVQKKFFMPDDISNYRQLGQQYGILLGVFERILESNFLEALFNSYVYFSYTKLKNK